MSETDFDKLIKNSLEDGLSGIKFSEQDKEEVLYAVGSKSMPGIDNKSILNNKSILERIKGFLDYEFEIPVPYLAASCLFLLFFLGYNLSGYFPTVDQINSYQLNWIEISYRGFIN